MVKKMRPRAFIFNNMRRKTWVYSGAKRPPGPSHTHSQNTLTHPHECTAKIHAVELGQSRPRDTEVQQIKDVYYRERDKGHSETF